ncbi:hypothetical protein AB4486_19565 [Vibrio sp. 10N.222.55.C6]|uniref:hypothetical protein n=1 Tax=Vibrio sp. 10N.222.55.C6 TaxID=3229649 RepID=UPI00354C138E
MKSNKLLTSIDGKIDDFYQEHMKKYHQIQQSANLPRELNVYRNKTNVHVNEFIGLCQHYDIDILKIIIFKKKDNIRFNRFLVDSYSRPLIFCAVCMVHPQGNVTISGFYRRILIGALNKNKVMFNFAKKIQKLFK